jgi:predicted MFS family arabinose efflux permease
MNTIIITLFLNSWVKAVMSGDPKGAYSRAMMVSGIANCMGLISAILFGFIFEKMTNSALLLLNNILVAIGYLSLIFIPEDNNLIILSFCIAAFGFYGLTTVGFIILNKNVGCECRGAVMGINSWTGAFGILILSKVGGLMFVHVDYLCPFYIVAATSVIMIIILCFPSMRETINKNEIPDFEEI